MMNWREKLRDFQDNFGYLRAVDNISQYNVFEKIIFGIDRWRHYYLKPQSLFDQRPMIFGIGLSKTGTTSLTEAIRILGYSASHWEYPKTILKYKSGQLFVNCNRLLINCHGYTDTPIARTYKLLDSVFPNSKFILTIREEESWFNSYENFLGILAQKKSVSEITDNLHYELYGSIHPNKSQNIKAFIEHRETVKEYFKDRQDDLLIMNIMAGDGWEKLCPFLGVPIPNQAFPRKNISKYS